LRSPPPQVNSISGKEPHREIPAGLRRHLPEARHDKDQASRKIQCGAFEMPENNCKVKRSRVPVSSIKKAIFSAIEYTAVDRIL
jgi:hypothetical protein